MITRGTWVELNGKRYLAMPGGNVRLTVKRNGQAYDRWFQYDEPIAIKVFKIACGEA